MPVHLVADIGGSSSRWVVLAGDAEPRVIEGLPGFNPAVGDPVVFQEALRERFDGEGLTVSSVHAYGAGCGHVDRAARLERVLRSVWPATEVSVASDLLGAARGSLGDRSGFVLILGTGLNAGWFDGIRLHQPMPSLGYILGDEGSGADIGKHAVIDALHGRMPKPVMERVFPGGIDVATTVAEVYRGTAPQAWLASFTERIAGVEHPYAQALIVARFQALADRLVEHFPADQRAVVEATGSVAFGLQGMLREVLAARRMRLNAVQRSPMAGLLRYHAALRR
jgi:glucosamine kinase